LHGEKLHPESLHPALIAPCGINCGLCHFHLREKNRCDGCRGDAMTQPKHCATCKMRSCAESAPEDAAFCSSCATFPCTRMKQFDRRYRTKYHVSVVENLRHIQEFGMDSFIAAEKLRWACPECGGIVCMHEEACIYCGHPRAEA
jgi:hypothetical protein